jgi:HAD superfamily hydrolase (TIGR01484 family)
MNKKVIAFDLDDTLCIAKSPIEDEMSETLVRLLEKFEVCVISGSSFERLHIQVIDRLNATPGDLANLHLMPTSGTKYYVYDKITGQWQLKYDHKLTDDQKNRAFKSLESHAKSLGFWVDDPYGDIIEDRDSQVTYSALGQKAPADIKYEWDPSGEKKMKLRDLVAKDLDDMEVRTGGTTSVDVTMMGVDKAYGMQKLMEQMDIGKSDILFIGDKLQPGGNDYAVKAAGIDTIEVAKWQDTIKVINDILAAKV